LTWTIFCQQLINGVSLGSLYGLVAIGYTMVYGILRLINFAHGDLLMFAAYAAISGIVSFGLPWYLGFPTAIVLTGAIGIVLDRVAYKPLRNAPRISLLISAIGASFLLENLATVMFTGRPKAFPQPALFTNSFHIGQVAIQNLTVIIPVVTVVLLVLLINLIYHTKIGMETFLLRASAKRKLYRPSLAPEARSHDSCAG
jgi:branched-chain amino acid transport system permease protein